MASYDLLVIDDFVLMDLDLERCSDLFEILEARDNQKATIIASHIPVMNWWDMFRNRTYADGCLSRAIFRAYRLECNGCDMRQPQ